MMNVRTDFPVLLWIEWPADSDVNPDDVLTLLVDYPVEAIHEEESDTRICWTVSFGESAWEVIDDPDHDLGESSPLLARSRMCRAPLDAKWRRVSDLSELITAVAGRRLVDTFRGAGLSCELLAFVDRWPPAGFEESYGRVQVGRIIVSPPWQFPDARDGTIILTVKPSTGFGTGHHPSTRLALALLQEVACDGREALDVGTGSGVLAMAASRLGASRVCAIDRDADALAAARENVWQNPLTRHVELKQADISTDWLGEFDLVVANLEAAQIRARTEVLLRHVRSTGQLILSGFLTAESELVLRGLPQPPRVVLHEDGWTAALCNR